VGKAGNRARFHIETPAAFGIVGRFGRQDLDGHGTIKPGVA
jgi:hypothetical protein